MTPIPGANTLNKGNALGFLTICGKSKIAFASKNLLQVQTGQDIRISTVTQGAFLPGIKNIKTSGDNNSTNGQLLLLWLQFKFDSSSRAALLTEIASLPFGTETKPFIENIGKRRRFSKRWINRLGISRANVSTKTTGYAPFFVDVPRLLNYLDMKITQFATEFLYGGID